MANRRCFSMDIVDSDVFLEMPTSAQSLYFHICMRSDDDGFCDSPKKILKMLGLTRSDLGVLIKKKFLLKCKNNVVLVKHWWLHNTKRKDTYKQSNYIKDNPNLHIDENKAYTFSENCESYRSVNGSLTQINKNKINEIENNINNKQENNESLENSDKDSGSDWSENMEETIRIAKTPWLDEGED